MKRISAQNPTCYANFAELDDFMTISVGFDGGGVSTYTTLDIHAARRFARELHIAADRMEEKIAAELLKEIAA